VRTLVVWCPDWPVVAAGVPPDAPAAVLRAGRVVAASPAARADGVAPGMRRRESQARCPALLVLDHDPSRDARAFEPVVTGLEPITPRIEISEPGRCCFPTRGPSRYFGGDEALVARAARLAVERSGVDYHDVVHVNAHATSTPAGDTAEAKWISALLGDQTVVAATKSMTGHLLGAAGAIEAIATVLTIREGIVPPTINLTDPDPACDLDFVPGQARKADVEVAMSNGFGFGGHNAVLIFRRHDA